MGVASLPERNRRSRVAASVALVRFVADSTDRRNTLGELLCW